MTTTADGPRARDDDGWTTPVDDETDRPRPVSGDRPPPLDNAVSALWLCERKTPLGVSLPPSPGLVSHRTRKMRTLVSYSAASAAPGTQSSSAAGSAVASGAPPASAEGLAAPASAGFFAPLARPQLRRLHVVRNG